MAVYAFNHSTQEESLSSRLARATQKSKLNKRVGDMDWGKDAGYQARCPKFNPHMREEENWLPQVVL